MTLLIDETKEIYNISTLINDQLIALIKVIKDNPSDESSDLNININLQIHSLKKIEDKTREKKFFSICLNDNLYKYGRFILMESELSNQLQIGYIINIKKITSKRVSSGLYIMIKDFSIISDKYDSGLFNVKLIKENDEKIFMDEDGNNVEEIKTNDEIEEKINDEKNFEENNNLMLNFDCIINILKDVVKNNLKAKKKKKIKNKLNKKIITENKENINNVENKKVIYTSLKELTTFSRDFILLVRIIKKSEIKIFETRNTNNSNILTGQGRLFYFIVLDQDGNEMQCTCFNKTVNKFYDLIQENKLYEIKGG